MDPIFKDRGQALRAIQADWPKSVVRQCERIAVIAVALGNELNLSDEDLADLRFSAALLGIDSNPAMAYEKVASLPLFSNLAESVGSSQEHFDGSGKPLGLAGMAIPLAGRILGVAIAWDSLTFPPKQTPAETLIQVQSRGTEFDPAVVAKLPQIMDIIQPLAVE